MNINWVPNKNINQELVNNLMIDSIKSGQFTNNGPNVQRLEKFIFEKLQIQDSKEVICINNGTAAIHALVAGIQEILNEQLQWATQSFTFPPSAQINLSNALIIDIDKDGGIDLEKIPNHVNGVVVTNIFGNIVDIEKYENWAKDNNKIVIFDNAATPFTFYKGINCVNYGVGSTISFHHTKPLGFGEGGAIIVDKKYAASIRRLINFGFDNHTKVWDKNASNYKMSDIAAVYILQYLNEFDIIVNKHKELYKHMLKLVENTDIHFFPNFSNNDPFISCFCLLSPRFNEKLVNDCSKAGVMCRKYYKPLIDTPVATDMYNNIICIPCTKDMTIDDINNIFKLIS